MFRLGQTAAIWLVALATVAAGQPAPSSRVGGWLGASIDDWSFDWGGPRGQLLAGQTWGRRTAPDGVRFLETFGLGRDLRRPYYEVNAQLSAVAPLGRVGSLRLGLSPSADGIPYEGGVKYADVTSSFGLTLNADDWDMMVAPAEMTYRGPGLKLNVGYGIWDLLDPPSKLNHSVRLDASAPWTLRFGGTRLEVGPTVILYAYSSSTMDHSESRSLGGQVLLAGGSRLVDIFVTPEFFATDGLGYEATLTASHIHYYESDSLFPMSDNSAARAQVRLAARVLGQTYFESGLEARASSYAWGQVRLQPRVAVARLWPLARGLVLPVQVSATLPVGLDLEDRYRSVDNEDVVLDVRVGLCSVSPRAAK
jgi:hypothetical protein